MANRIGARQDKLKDWNGWYVRIDWICLTHTETPSNELKKHEEREKMPFCSGKGKKKKKM